MAPSTGCSVINVQSLQLLIFCRKQSQSSVLLTVVLTSGFLVDQPLYCAFRSCTLTSRVLIDALLTWTKTVLVLLPRSCRTFLVRCFMDTSLFTAFIFCTFVIFLEIIPVYHHWVFEDVYYYNYNRFMALWIQSRTTQVSWYQKSKTRTNLDFMEQETVSGSGISWAICTL